MIYSFILVVNMNIDEKVLLDGLSTMIDRNSYQIRMPNQIKFIVSIETSLTRYLAVLDARRKIKLSTLLSSIARHAKAKPKRDVRLGSRVKRMPIQKGSALAPPNKSAFTDQSPTDSLPPSSSILPRSWNRPMVKCLNCDFISRDFALAVIPRRSSSFRRFEERGKNG